MTIQKITPFLWYASEAEEAAAFYAGIFPDSRVVSVTTIPAAHGVKVVEFVLCGQPFTAMSVAGADGFNHSISLMVNCADQAELDRYWNGLLEGGGAPEACGWLKDRFGVSWQIVPDDLMRMMEDTDPVKQGRVAEAMLKMVKFDAAALRAAYAGTTA
ncbi:VOC family protein [Trinickia caryophylli]|uniref:Glyoxalase superfamily enzyme, possibly 3-demethylubiquinone-9 3-methyltransferase n=1 Tax=Trinickia caryophylli TaxID=28094 RepID=A0A1X7GEX5_TRICW|nr:VOC family protein [Trinickia caryophylli]PMS10746.1 VOC family protein [Trinickia caryophylli]TRX13876.1 VOC family protein [Trinickia caryophylli]WQE15467.1 VOC family protein [Trinickia caryophylli]SMF68796.1 Glyoxalase superfamily enzyme, possibly 3-demethylubiquinone-9 3-methyltransferase [Trinickia caryophylli]GLU33791.1 VOC family protein [Trinickia caryophylli]